MEYDIGREEAVSTAVVRAVGDAPASMRPLADVLDPAALDRLFEPREPETSRAGGRLTFVYGRCRVGLEGGEDLSVEPLSDRDADRAH